MIQPTLEQAHAIRTPIGKKLLEKSHSTPQKFLETSQHQVESMQPGQIKDLYLQIVDERRREGADVGNEELMMSSLVQGEIEEPSYLLQAETYIIQYLENERKQFDSLSGLAFYTDEMRLRIINAYARLSARGGTPSFTVIVGDINRLKELNNMYSKPQANKAIEVIGDSLKKEVEKETFLSDAEVFMGRMKQTGDEFLVVVLGDEEAAQKITTGLEIQKWPKVHMRNQETQKMDLITASMRVQSMTINSVGPDQDFGILLNETIEKVEKDIDLTGHARA